MLSQRIENGAVAGIQDDEHDLGVGQRLLERRRICLSLGRIGPADQFGDLNSSGVAPIAVGILDNGVVALGVLDGVVPLISGHSLADLCLSAHIAHADTIHDLDTVENQGTNDIVAWRSGAEMGCGISRTTEPEYDLFGFVDTLANDQHRPLGIGCDSAEVQGTRDIGLANDFIRHLPYLQFLHVE